MELIKKFWPYALAAVILGGYILAAERSKSQIDYEQIRSDAAAMTAMASMSAASDAGPRPVPMPNTAPTPAPTPSPSKPLTLPKVGYVQLEDRPASGAEQGGELLFPDLAKLLEVKSPETPPACPLKPVETLKAAPKIAPAVPPQPVPKAQNKQPAAAIPKPIYSDQRRLFRG